MFPAPRTYGTKCKELVIPTRKSEALYFGRYVSRHRKKVVASNSTPECTHHQSHISDVKCLIQGCRKPGHQVTVEAAIIIILPKICGPSVRNWNHVTFLAPKILR
jgi:hypothetical protein